MELAQLLGVGPGVTAIIGSGGKTTALYQLARELAGQGRKVICATTTHIRPPDHLPVADGGAALERALKETDCVCAGSPAAEGKLGPGRLSPGELAKLCDCLLLEADGSKHLPLKAHAPYEPVIPPETGRVVLVVGASGLGRPIGEAVHRPEIFCRLTGASPEEAATPERVAAAIRAEGLGGIPLINQTDAAPRAAETLAALLPGQAVLAALERGEWKYAGCDSGRR